MQVALSGVVVGKSLFLEPEMQRHELVKDRGHRLSLPAGRLFEADFDGGRHPPAVHLGFGHALHCSARSRRRQNPLELAPRTEFGHSSRGGDPRQTSLTQPQPGRTSRRPARRSRKRQRGAHSRIGIRTFAAMRRCWGAFRYGLVRRDTTMPTNKDFKRLVRARMEKTGEAYTAARANLLKRGPATARMSAPANLTREPAAPAIPVAPAALVEPAEPANFAKLAGMSDAAIKKATGCTWEKWAFALDYSGAETWSHRAIAEHVQRAYKTSDWWAQMVTVGYERIKGLREIGQRRSGGFEATKSKTIAAPASTVFRAFNDARARRKWLPGVKVTVRKAVPGKSVRMTWEDGTLVEVWLTSKGAKTAASVSHRKLSGKEDVERRKQFWGERLTALQRTLENRA